MRAANDALSPPSYLEQIKADLQALIERSRFPPFLILILNINERGYYLELNEKERSFLKSYFFYGFFAGRTLATSGPEIKHGVHCHAVLTLQIPFRPLASRPDLSATASRARALAQQLFPAAGAGLPCSAWLRAAAGRAAVCAMRSGGRSPAPAPLLSSGGGRRLLFLRSFFPVPRAFSRLWLHPPPTLPQIYSSTLGELGRHPASPIGLPSNWCIHRPAPGGELGRREGGGSSRP